MRKILSKTFDIIWTIWSVFVIVTVLALFSPVVMLLVLIQTDGAIRLAGRFIKKVFFVASLFMGILPLYKGKKQVSKKNNYIYIANHRSYLDIIFAIIIANPDTKFLGKAEMFKWPVIGYFAGKLAHVPVNRSSANARKKSFLNILKTVQNGHSLFLFPEGGIFQTEQLLFPFKSGAFRLAIETQKPLVVMTFINAGRLNPSNNWFAIRPGRAINYISEPIETKGMTMDDVHTLKQMAMDEMRKNLLKYYPKGRYPKY